MLYFYSEKIAKILIYPIRSKPPKSCVKSQTSSVYIYVYTYKRIFVILLDDKRLRSKMDAGEQPRLGQ